MKHVDNPFRLFVATPRVVCVDINGRNGGLHKVLIPADAARAIADSIALGPDQVESFVFLLRQGADAVDALDAKMKQLHDVWLTTQPERA